MHSEELRITLPEEKQEGYKPSKNSHVWDKQDQAAKYIHKYSRILRGDKTLAGFVSWKLIYLHCYVAPTTRQLYYLFYLSVRSES